MPIYPMKFAFTPKKNERIEAVITVPEDPRSIIHGTVYDVEGNRIKEAVVRLFVQKDDQLEPVSHAFTDDMGEFIFGPVRSESAYVVKVYYGGIKIRELTVRQRRKKTDAPAKKNS